MVLMLLLFLLLLLLLQISFLFFFLFSLVVKDSIYAKMELRYNQNGRYVYIYVDTEDDCQFFISASLVEKNDNIHFCSFDDNRDTSNVFCSPDKIVDVGEYSERNRTRKTKRKNNI